MVGYKGPYLFTSGRLTASTPNHLRPHSASFPSLFAFSQSTVGARRRVIFDIDCSEGFGKLIVFGSRFKTNSKIQMDLIKLKKRRAAGGGERTGRERGDGV